MKTRCMLALLVLAALSTAAHADGQKWAYATLQYTDVTEDSYFFDAPDGRHKGFAGYSAMGGKLSRKEWDGAGYAGRIRAYMTVIGERGWELSVIEIKGSTIGTVYWFKRPTK